MMPAVGSVPVQSSAGVNAATSSAGASGVNGADGNGSAHENGFGSVMTAALADASHGQPEVSGKQAAGKPQGTETLKTKVASQNASSSEGGAVAMDGAGSDKATSGVHAAEVASLQEASGAAAKEKEAAAQKLPVDSTKPGTGNGDANTGSSSTVKPGNAVAELKAVAKTTPPGLKAVDVAGQNAGQVVAAKGLADKPGAAASKGSKADSKKTEGKAVSAAQAVTVPNAMALPAVAMASAAPAGQAAVPVVKSASARGDGKSNSGTAMAVAGRNLAAMNATGVKNAASGAAPSTVAAADARGNANSKTASASEGSSGSAGKIDLVPNAAIGVVVDAGANAGSGAGQVAHAGHDAKQALVKAGQGLAVTHPQNVTEKGVNTSGPFSNGFTASLLNGHPAVATAAAHAQTHAAVTNGGVGAANPYTRLDETQGHTLVFASPQKMSVAVSDPSLGSFQVRAQSAGAQVAASLATVSTTTHAQLSGQLPSLTAFLQEQRVDLARVTVVQQSMLGGDTGARDFSGQQQGRSDSSGSRGARAQGGRVGSAGSVGLVTGASSLSGAVGLSAGDGMAVEDATASVVTPQSRAGGGVGYVDVLA